MSFINGKFTFQMIPKKMWISIIIYILISVLIVFSFKFVDIFNFRGFLYNSSFLFLNQNPYILFPQPFPPNFYSFLIPTFLVYIVSGSNLFAAVDFLKIFQLIVSILESLIIYFIVLEETGSEKKGKAAFYAIIFSPFLFSVNFIETEQSPVGILFALLALYLFIKMAKQEKYSYIMLISASVLLWYSVFIYYFPIVIVAALLIYQKNVRNFLKMIFGMGIGLSVFYLPFRFTNFWELFTNLSGIAAPPTKSAIVFSIINFFSASSGFQLDKFQVELQAGMNVLFLLSLLLVPIIFKIYKRPLYSAISLIFIILFITIGISNYDEFVWIIPFITIAVAVNNESKFLTLRLFLLQLYLIPYFIIFNMWGAPGYGSGSGIYYLSYLQFHNSTAIYNFFPNPVSFTKFFIFLGFLFLIYLAFLSIEKPPNDSVGNNEPRTKFNTISSIFSGLTRWKSVSEVRPREGNKIKVISKDKKSTYILASFIVGIIIIVLLSGINYGGNISITQEGQNFPLGLFNSYANMNSSFSYGFADGNRAIVVAPTNYNFNYPPYQPLAFSRNISGENVDMDLRITPMNMGDYPYNVTVMEIGSVKMNLLNGISIPPGTTLLPPISEYKTNISGAPSPLLSNKMTVPIYSMLGDSVQYYKIPLTNYENTHYLIFHENNSNFNQNMIFLLYYNGLQIEFLNGRSQDNFVLGYNDPALGPNWDTVHVYYGVPLNNWDIVSLYFTETSAIFDFNNLSPQVINYNFTTNSTVSLFVGKYGLYNSSNFKYAFDGQVSPLMVSPNGIYYGSTEMYVSYFNSSRLAHIYQYFPYINNNIYLTYYNQNISIYTNGIHILASNRYNFASTPNSQMLQFGRLSNSSIYFKFGIPYIDIESISSMSYLWEIIILDYVLPIYILLFIFLERKFSHGL